MSKGKGLNRVLTLIDNKKLSSSFILDKDRAINIPISRIYPSGLQSQLRRFDSVFFLSTLDSSAYQIPKSAFVHDAKFYKTGLKESAFILSV